jgi:RNA polymerase sigma-70 factor (ECF subfamily)
MPAENIIRQALVRYERPLVSYAKGIVGDLESARDVVQETFLRLSKQDVVALEPRLAPWLFFVCRNCAFDARRKVVRFADGELDENFPDTRPSPDVEAGAAEDRSRLRELVERLPERQRELVVLKFDGGLSYKEIAAATRLSVSNVGYQLHHAIATLRTLWNQETEVNP